MGVGDSTQSDNARGTSLWRRWAIPLGIALIGLAVNLVVATSMSVTTDEEAHLSYGAAILNATPDRSKPSFDSKMPVSAMNALPRVISNLLLTRGIAAGFAEKLGSFRVARFPTVVAAFCLSLLCYLYAASLFGHTAGIFSQVLLILSPNLLAHSTLSTNDLYVALATLLFLYFLQRFLRNPTRANAALTAAALGLAQLTKFSAIYLYLVFGLAILSVALYSRLQRKRLLTLRQLLTILVLTAVFSVAWINLGFLFDRTFTPLSRFTLRSATFQRLQRIPVLREIPLPLPYAYVQGFDWLSYHNSTALSFGNIVLLDQVRGRELPRSDGFPHYYLVAYLLKEPLGMQLLLLLGLLWIARHRRLHDFLTGEWLLLLTAGVFLVMLSLFSKAQIGIRHILPVLVIFVILSGGAFAAPLTTWKRRFMLGACMLWAAVSVGSYFPHMIPYFNEIVTDKKQAYHFLADSNLDWGQDMYVVKKFLKSNPDVVLDPPEPTTGRVLVRANLVAGVVPPKADYWVRQKNLQPVAHVGYAHFLFQISPQK